MSEFDSPVVVVGAGPAGLATSLLLSRQGVAHILLEKYTTLAHTPRAHIINQRTVEILRDLGIEERLLAVGTPQELMGDNVWATSLAGRELARLKTWGTHPLRAAEYALASPCQMSNCGQHLLEPVLMDGVTEAGVAEVRMNTELVGLEQDEEGVTLTTLDRATGTQSTIRTRYVVGADGGRSRVLTEAGLTVEGQAGLGAAGNIWFRADLGKYTAYRPSALYWSSQPGTDYFIGAGTLICHKPWTEWVMVFMYNPETDVIDESPEALAARVRKVIGDDSVEIEVLGMSTWEINRLIAPEYRSGRVVCIGDAVHRHPPANGLGLNVSIADAFNVAWKLKLVLDGTAPDALLDTVTEERQPVGLTVVDRALQSIGDMAGIPEALGFKMDQSADDGWAALDGLFEATEEGARRRRAYQDAIQLTNYQFNAHGIEVGYRYRAGAVVPDGSPEPQPDRDPQLHYQPTTWPGAHLPHAWIEEDRRRLSTLDLTGHGRFTLLTGIGGEPWEEAARQAAAHTGVEIDVRFVGTRDGVLDPYGDWARLREVQDSGCVLVRPDHHVAWRAQRADPDLVRQLPDVLAQALGIVAAADESALAASA
ncbi:MAG: 2,4-dichlorophenol 6-monooxygenase [Conexibacter sp.]|nr:2,4-dichlorophenol 6-monooxygenase [Conexibacter sp.]